MFESLTSRVSRALSQIGGKRTLSEDNIAETLREVRLALLDADVALSVVQDLLGQVRQRALGSEVSASLSPGQTFLKIVNEVLVEVIGGASEGLNLNTQPPAIILLAGLQGAGKTTSAAKLGVWLKEKQKKRVMVVSADVYRPAAIEQLRTLADSASLEFFESSVDQAPAQIAKDALAAAKTQFMDVLIVDTAGRLAIDDAMMAEISSLQTQLNPIETLFVVDAMTGQDAANTAKQFGDTLFFYFATATN